MEIRAIAIDDDPMSILLVKNFCKQYENINMVATFTDPIAGSAAIEELKPDLVFLDVEMPQLSGLEVLDCITELPTVIVMSSNPIFEKQALERNAHAFVSKPLTAEKFSSLVDPFTAA